jgi:hypothetical protein
VAHLPSCLFLQTSWEPREQTSDFHHPGLWSNPRVPGPALGRGCNTDVFHVGLKPPRRLADKCLIRTSLLAFGNASMLQVHTLGPWVGLSGTSVSGPLLVQRPLGAPWSRGTGAGHHLRLLCAAARSNAVPLPAAACAVVLMPWTGSLVRCGSSCTQTRCSARTSPPACLPSTDRAGCEIFTVRTHRYDRFAPGTPSVVDPIGRRGRRRVGRRAGV